MGSQVYQIGTSLVNPYPDFSKVYGFRYGFHQFVDLTSRADQIHNPFFWMIAQIGARSIDFIAALFYNPIAFIVNNTAGRLYNRAVGICNEQYKKVLKQAFKHSFVYSFATAAVLVGSWVDAASSPYRGLAFTTNLVSRATLGYFLIKNLKLA